MLDRIYLALLPVAMQVQGWTLGDVPISTGDKRVELAIAWARIAYKKRPAP